MHRLLRTINRIKGELKFRYPRGTRTAKMVSSVFVVVLVIVLAGLFEIMKWLYFVHVTNSETPLWQYIMLYR